MKFKNEENRNFIIEVNANEKVINVKRRLSETIFQKIEDFLLVYKSMILDDERLVDEYQIKPEEIVLIYSKVDFLAAVLRSDIDRRIAKLNQKDSKKKIFSSNNKETINELDFGIEKYLIFKCANFKYEPMTHKIDFVTNGENCRKLISEEIDIPWKHIQLFKDIGLTIEIKDFDNFTATASTPSSRITIYYEIKPDLDKLIKRDFLGHGCFGTIWRCTEIETRNEFALKKFDITLVQAESFQYLNNELDVLCALGNHPGIVSFIKTVQKKSAIYMVMEYVPGGSLSTLTRKTGTLPDNQIRHLSNQILEALHYLHGKKIVHRHIKGNNVLLDREGNAKLCDFGLARILTDIASNDYLNGASQSFHGTANYMAPEVMNGKPCGPCADIWSFGATVIEMVTGRPPYDKFSVFQVLSMISIHKTIAYDRSKSSNPALHRFIDQCLEPEPLKRPSASMLLRHEFFIENVNEPATPVPCAFQIKELDTNLNIRDGMMPLS